MTLEGFQRWSLQLDEVDRQIAETDSYEGTDIKHIPLSNGPFNVFHVQPVSVEGPIESDFDHQHLALELVVAPVDCKLPEIDSVQEHEISDGSMTVHTWEVFDWQYQLSSTRSRVSSSPFNVIPIISQDPTINRLMENYARNVANVLPALRHHDNPYSTIYLPKAMNGASNIAPNITSSVSRLVSCEPDIAVFYALLATSAFHLRGSHSENGSYFDVLARHFRAKAFASLRKALPGACQDREPLALNNQSTFPPRESVLSAMLTLVTMDNEYLKVMEGSMSEYWVHLGGINKVVRQLSSGTQDSRINLQLVTIASFLSTLAKTTSIDLPTLPWTGEQYSSRNRGSGIGYGLEFTYGITPVLASYMERIVTLSQHISYYVTNNTLAVPPSLISSCLSLSNELSEWSIESESLSTFFSGADTDTNITLLLAKHHIIAFADALRLYLHTRLLPCSPDEMELCVDRVASHLIEIEDLKAVAGHGFNATATIAWPGFIASCEANVGAPRQVWYRWWTYMLKYRIGNIDNLWKVVQEAWRLKDIEGFTEVPAWMPVLRCSRQHILAV